MYSILVLFKIALGYERNSSFVASIVAAASDCESLNKSDFILLSRVE